MKSEGNLKNSKIDVVFIRDQQVDHSSSFTSNSRLGDSNAAGKRSGMQTIASTEIAFVSII